MSASIEALAAHGPSPTAAGMTVVVVDDDPTMVDLLTELAERHVRCTAIGFTASRRALEWLAEGDPDLVLLDRGMPDLDGIALLRRIRADPRHADVPVMMITGADEDPARQMALEQGATDFLTKPLRQAEFRARLANLLGLRRHQRAERERADLLEQRVAERTRTIEDREIEIVLRLCRAAEFRDHETGAHVERISHYAKVVAAALGAPGVVPDDLFFAAALHDVGKLAVPDAILLKPGRLLPAERALMEQHTVRGHEMLRGSASRLVAMGAEIALTHHERWDGNGYPLRLAGDAIPIASRIVAVVDVFDALTSVRPYKAAQSAEEAVSHLMANAGTHFDPQVVGAFTRAWPEILGVRRRFAAAPASPDAAADDAKDR